MSVGGTGSGGDFEFGLVGFHHRLGRTKGSDPQEFIEREVSAAVRYAPPPLKDKAWTQTGERRYEMKWSSDSDGPPGEAVSLEALVEPIGKAAQTGATATGTNPEAADRQAHLDRLDACVQTLLATVEDLHGGHCGIGLVAPENIFFTACREASVVLPDLGFYYSKDAPPPQFVSEPRIEKELPRLWGCDVFEQLRRGVRQDPPAQQAEVTDPAAAFDPVPDIRTLGRLFASVLLGGICDKVPREPRTYGPLWTVLKEAIEGKITSVGDLRRRLQDAPLSTHFTYTPPAPPPPDRVWRKRAVAVAVLAGLAIAAGGMTYVYWPEPIETARIDVGNQPDAGAKGTKGSGKEPSPGTKGTKGSEKEPSSGTKSTKEPKKQSGPDAASARELWAKATYAGTPPVQRPPEGSEIGKLLEEFDRTPPSGRGPVMPKLFGAALSPDPAAREIEMGWIANARQRYVEEGLKKQWNEVIGTLAQDPAKRATACAELSRILKEIQQLGDQPTCPHLQEKEKSWRERCETFARQLGCSW